MKLLNQYTRKLTSKMTSEWMPFADVATAELPLSRLLRLSMFQLSIGLATALLVGTLNRVMIVELGVPAWWVALSVALPLVFAPLRALIGFKSDKHRSALGLRRLPYLWIGTLLLFGGLAIMPFALLALTTQQPGMVWVSRIGAALAFNGSSGYVSIPNQALLNPAQITVETWAEFTGPVVDLWTMLVAKGYDGNCPYNLLLAQGRGAGAIGFGGWVTSETIAASPAGTVATAERHYLAGTCDPTYYNIYTDGILRGSTSGPGSLPSNGTPLGFGASSSWYGGPCFYFNGTLDEIRLSSVPRSSNWVWACWMNVASNSSFVTAAPASAGFSTAAPQGPIYRFW